jgi:hypothetical protein
MVDVTERLLNIQSAIQKSTTVNRQLNLFKCLLEGGLHWPPIRFHVPGVWPGDHR